MGDALTTPLRLWLLRKVYIEPKGDPAELLQLQTPGQIGDHLLDELTPRLIEANRDREGELGQQESPFRPKKTWNADDAQRWLRYLAYFLKQLQPILDRLAEKQRTAANGSKPTERQVSEAVWKQADEATATSQQPNMASLYRPNEELQLNLGWWQLHYAVALRPVKVALGVIAGAVFGLALSPLFAVSCACLGGLLFYYGKEEPEAEPRYANLRLHGRMRKLSKKSWNAFKFTILLGLTAVPIFTVLIGLRTALVVGLTYALVGGVAFTLSDSIATPSIDDDRARTPKSTLATDRAMTVVHFLAVGLTNAVALGLAFGPAVGLAVAVTFALVGGLGTHLELPLPRGQLLHVPFGFSEVGTAWSVFLVVRIRLAIQRKLPFRLSTFLDDCYRLGLLKQDGPYYQFRHSELQLRMASLYEESKDKNRRGSRTAS